LAGRSVVIWRDNDLDGRAYQQRVIARLLPLRAAIRVIDVAALGLPHRGDVMDWLAAQPGATAADVMALPTIDAASALLREEDRADLVQSHDCPGGRFELSLTGVRFIAQGDHGDETLISLL